MEEIKVEIEGSAILMNNPQSMMDDSPGIKKTTKKYDPKQEAIKRLYKAKNGKLFVPSIWLYRAMVNASAYKKAGKYSLRPILAGAVRIEPEEIDLGTKKYEVDIRTVVIQKSRIVRARPRINDWKLSFTLIYDSDLIADPYILKEVLEDAGKRVGIGDYRPQKLGPFGTFTITKFEPNGHKA